MPVFILAIIAGLYNMVGALVTSVLIKLALGFVTYQGMNILMSSITNQIFSNLDSTGSTIISIMGLLKVGSGINVILSAIAVRQVLQGFNSGSIKRMVQK